MRISLDVNIQERYRQPLSEDLKGEVFGIRDLTRNIVRDSKKTRIY